MRLYDLLLSSIAFWLAWIMIPVIFEILPSFGSFFLLLKKGVHTKHTKKMKFYPEITLIVPVYNSAKTLEKCLHSICDSSYPKEKIQVLLVNNEGTDESFEIYQKVQSEFNGLNMCWMNAKQGKSKALNLALYNSNGKYIIHIDSDGVLHSDALTNMVRMFEENQKISCLTGTIMTDPSLIQQSKTGFLRLFRKIEFFEYCQAFLSGRNLESEFNHVYTISGAFTGFRKSTILKTQLYNADTVCEDTHITFQVRDMLNKSVKLCHNAFFFVEPIDGWNQLYVQRQRWQRGEIEVAHMFLREELKLGQKFVSNFAVRLMFYDHTFAFPRMIWYFALLFLTGYQYPVHYVLISVVMVYSLYVLTGFLHYVSIGIFLREYRELQGYYLKKWYVLFLLPFYNFVVFWFRFAGIVNCIQSDQAWKGKNLTEKRREFFAICKEDFIRVTRLFHSKDTRP